MKSMAENINILDAIKIGSLIQCRLYSNKDVEGEVVAWDQEKKVMILKTESATRSNLNNVEIINTAFITDFEVKKQMSSPVCQPPSSLNVQRLKNRAEEQIRQKQRLVNALKAGLSPEGQRLFTAIKKTIEDVSWNKDDIIVMDKVCISKPYTPDCVKALNESVPEKAIEHVRKIVEKHIQDREEIKTRGN